MNERPNIVLIIVDQMRRDCMGVAGNDIVETPVLDMMKKKGYMFNHAYSAVPSCIASRAAIMTGLSQKRHGRVGYKDGVPWDYEHMLAGEFAKGGYHTQCVGKMHVFPERSLCGFHNIILHDGYLHYTRNYRRDAGETFTQTDDYLVWLKRELGADRDLTDSGLECNSWVSRPFPYDEYYHPTNWVVHESIDFLRRRDTTKPFFLTASFVRPHSPLDPPQFYFDMYKDKAFDDIPVGDWADTEDAEQNGLDISCDEGKIHPDALRRARAAYYGLITHIDHQIGRLLHTFNEHRLLNNTIFLFTSDHGDMLGDHNLFRKGLPYEGSAGIPFLIYDPGRRLGQNQNKTIDAPVELRDIMPSLLDMAGLDIPEVDGKSVLPLIRGEMTDWRKTIHGEHTRGLKSNHYITDGVYKYVWFSRTGEEQFFDLSADPRECRNALNDARYKDIIEEYRCELIKELTRRAEGFTDGKNLYYKTF